MRFGREFAGKLTPPCVLPPPTVVPARICRELASVAAADGPCRPSNVGILAMDMYFPRTFVQQVCGELRAMLHPLFW